jgi:chorismate synthase
MNDKINVLAVVNRLIRTSEADRRQFQLERFSDLECQMRDEELNARAAISELIDVAKDTRDSLSAANKVYADGAIGLLIERLTAALARVGGA